MKRHKKNNKDSVVKNKSKGFKATNVRHEQSKNALNDMLKMCLAKVCELQQELNRQSDYEDDPQAAGYAACAMETLQFLQREGLSSDHPMVKSLIEKLVPEEEK